MRGFAKKKGGGGEQKRANRIQNKINVKQKEHLKASELNITSERETDQRGARSLAANSWQEEKRSRPGVCASLLNNGCSSK